MSYIIKLYSSVCKLFFELERRRTEFEYHFLVKGLNVELRLLCDLRYVVSYGNKMGIDSLGILKYGLLFGKLHIWFHLVI